MIAGREHLCVAVTEKITSSQTTLSGRLLSDISSSFSSLIPPRFCADGYPGSSPRRLPGNSSRRRSRSEEHTSELQSPDHLVCRLLLEKKKKSTNSIEYSFT